MRTGTIDTSFLYNGRDGVMADANGLYYMRARYYSPELKRFINADVVAEDISNAITLNRYAYANGNPVSNVDPFGLCPQRGDGSVITAYDPSKNYYSLDDYNKYIKNMEKDISEPLAYILRHCRLVPVSGSYSSPPYVIYLGNGVSISRYISSTIGDGNINISNVLFEQTELLEALSVSAPIIDNYSFEFSKTSAGVKYTSDIDDYTNLSVTLSNGLPASYSAKYEVTTQYNDNSISTTLELEYTKSPNRKSPSSPPIMVPAPDFLRRPSLSYNKDPFSLQDPLAPMSPGFGSGFNSGLSNEGLTAAEGTVTVAAVAAMIFYLILALA